MLPLQPPLPPEAPPTEAALRNVIAAAQAANVVAARREPDPTYKSNVKNFKAFIDEKRFLGEVPQGNKYLTQNNVDLYFALHVARKGSVNHDTARRVVSSLQNYALNHEYIDGTSIFCRGE